MQVSILSVPLPVDSGDSPANHDEVIEAVAGAVEGAASVELGQQSSAMGAPSTADGIFAASSTLASGRPPLRMHCNRQKFLRPCHGLLWALVFLLMGCEAGEATPTPGSEIQVTVFVPTAAPSNTPRPEPPTPATQSLPAPAAAPAGAVSAASAISTTNTTNAPNDPNAPAGLVVTNEFVNVRKGPDVRYDFLGRLEQGAKVDVIGKSGDALWWQIEFAGSTGWVINDYVQANANAQNAPVVAVAPLPTETAASVRVIDIAPPATAAPAVGATAAPTPIPGPTEDPCSPNDPNWRGRDPSYPFCVRADMEWRNGDSSSERPVLYWDIYGAISIELRIEGFSRGGGRYPVAMAGEFQVNRKELSGCGKAELYVTRKDGVVAGYNEKFFCGA